MNLFGLKPYENPFDRNPRGVEPVGRTEFNDLKTRVERLERALDGLTMAPMRTMADSARHTLADGADWGPPWLSQSVRLAMNITSSEFGKQTFNDALMTGASMTVLGGLVSHFFPETPWYVLGPVAGAASFAVTVPVILLFNRTTLYTLARNASKAKERQRQELRVQIDKPSRDGRLHHVEFLCVAGITAEQLMEFAPVALRASSLAVNVHGGGGKLFSQGQAQALMAELEQMGLATASSGRQGRQLTRKGRAFFRGLEAL